MGMDKAIAHGKEHRAPYHKSGKFDSTCRPGGGCPYCKGNRMHGDHKRQLSASDQIREAVKIMFGEAGWIGADPGSQGVMAGRNEAALRKHIGNLEQAEDCCIDFYAKVTAHDCGLTPKERTEVIRFVSQAEAICSNLRKAKKKELGL